MQMMLLMCTTLASKKPRVNYSAWGKHFQSGKAADLRVDRGTRAWRGAGRAVHNSSSGSGSCAANTDVTILQVDCDMVANKVEKPRRPKVEAYQRLQRQPRESCALQLT